MNTFIRYLQAIILNIRKLSNKYLIASNTKIIAWIIIVFGIILRLSQYLFNRSLRPDESFLALNIVDKNYLDYLKPLDYHQAAPFGFLIIEKFVIQTFGNTDIMLRLFPLCAGILSLFLFYFVAKYNLNNKAMLISLGLFALSEHLINFSSELKQYSSDVATVLLLLAITYLVIEKKSNPYFVLFGFAGAVLIWFSHPAMITLAGVGTALGIYYLVEKDKSSFLKLLLVIAVWLVSFVLLFFFTLKYLANDTYMLGFWQSFFLPRNPFSTKINFLDWYLSKPFIIFQNPIGLYFSGLGVLTFIVGVIEYFRYRRFKLAIIISPLIVTLLAAILRKYPFADRMILFLTPVFLIIIGNGVGELFSKKFVNSNLLGTIVVILLFVHPFISGLRYLNTPRTRSELRLVMQQMEQHWKKGDTIFLYFLAEPGFKYYSSKFGFSHDDFIVGENFKGEWKNADQFLGTKRFWIVFPHISPRYPYAKEYYLSYLRNHGRELKSFIEDDASAYLFDLSPKK